MSAVEVLIEDAPREPEGLRVVANLDHGAALLLTDLMHRSGHNASDLIASALGAYSRELAGVVLPPPEPGSDVAPDQVLRESAADFEAGRSSTNEEVFARIAAKHGW